MAQDFSEYFNLNGPWGSRGSYFQKYDAPQNAYTVHGQRPVAPVAAPMPAPMPPQPAAAPVAPPTPDFSSILGPAPWDTPSSAAPPPVRPTAPATPTMGSALGLSPFNPYAGAQYRG